MNVRRFIAETLLYWGLVIGSVLLICSLGSIALAVLQPARAQEFAAPKTVSPKALKEMTEKEQMDALLKMNSYCTLLGGCKLVPNSDFEKLQQELKDLRRVVQLLSKGECT